jgi:hypothetical protein
MKQAHMYEEGNCKWCVQADSIGFTCGEDVKGYICTRERGHKGPHVACGPNKCVGDHPIAMKGE